MVSLVERISPALAPGCIEQVWNLRVLSGVLIYGIPVEELLFGVAFGLYWSGVYEHFTWTRTVPHTRIHLQPAVRSRK